MTQLSEIDMLWLLFCSCLLLIMQAGFTCYESGLIRSKNAANVVIKNLVDLTISIIFYGFVGFSIMFYSLDSFSQAFHPIFNISQPSIIVFFIFQAMFCATAVTITSGAVAERMSFIGYVILSVIVTCVIYPITGAWVWGDILQTNHQASWLANLGFHDFAGATVVHSVGGWVALSGILTIGPRTGRFGKNAKPISQSSITLASAGSLLIWVGWLGFNGGSTLGFSPEVLSVILNTILGGAIGLLVGMMSAYYLYKKALVLPMINGGLIGLISVTAAADLMEASDAIIIAIIASLSIIPMTNLLEKLKIDDAVGAVPVHLIGGIIASFSAGFFVELTPEQSRSDAILIQVLGILSVGAFVFLTSFSLLWVINKFVKLRVSEEEEMLGLNLSEHSVGATNQDMIMQINENLRTGDVSNKINVSAESDSYDIAQHYNSMVDMFENLSSHKEEALKKAVFEANHDALTNLLNRRAMNAALNTQVKNMQKTLEPICVALIDIDNFKRINDTHGHDVGDNVIQYTASSIRNFVKTTDIVARAGGEEFCIIFPSTTLNETAGLLENLRDKLASFPLYTGDISISFTVSIGLTEMAPNKTIAQTLKEADIALYQAKNDGRNRLGIY